MQEEARQREDFKVKLPQANFAYHGNSNAGSSGDKAPSKKWKNKGKQPASKESDEEEDVDGPRSGLEARMERAMREAELEDKPEDSDASQGNGGRRLFDRCTSLCSACPETSFDNISRDSEGAALSSHQRS